MRKKIFYGAMFGIFTLVLFMTASFYLEQNLQAAPGDWCECDCRDDAVQFCDSYGCRNYGGCIGLFSASSKCDSSGIYCDNRYILFCENGAKLNLLCSELCSSCDKSFWE